jgi:hypothetical protein
MATKVIGSRSYWRPQPRPGGLRSPLVSRRVAQRPAVYRGRDWNAFDDRHDRRGCAGRSALCVHTVQVAVPWALEESDNFRLDPASARLFEGLSYLIATKARSSQHVFVGAASKLFRKAEIYPTWLAWSGLVIAALNFLLAVPIHGVSLILPLPWALVVSVLMLPRVQQTARRRGTELLPVITAPPFSRSGCRA